MVLLLMSQLRYPGIASSRPENHVPGIKTSGDMPLILKDSTDSHLNLASLMLEISFCTEYHYCDLHGCCYYIS